jgi:carbamoyltransferase
MNILGICGGVRLGNWDSAAALVVDGTISAAAEEERFLRVKHAPGMLPTQAIRYCLQQAALAPQDVDLVVFPGRTYVNMKQRLGEYFRYVHGVTPRIELCDHHEAHAASAFYASGFPDALVVTADYSGDGFAATVWDASKQGLKALERWAFPNSMGAFYALITQHLGFDFGEDEYKVMGLASYGQATMDLSWLLSSTQAGYELDSAALRHTVPGEPPFSPQEPLFSQLVEQRLGPPRTKGAPVEDRHQNLAASAQRQLENVMLSLVASFRKRTASRHLCLAGGVAMNCVLNQKLAETGDFDSVYVPPVAGDNGLALGAALLCCAAEDRCPHPLGSAALGPEHSPDEMKKALQEVGAPYTEISNPASCAAEMLANGKIIGWFQGRMEYGARALGHRSILADPRISDMKDRVNAVVKFREGFRPFAPSIAEEAAAQFLLKARQAPFMTFTFDVRKDVASQIPAVTHVDGTARVQTVAQSIEPLYHSLLSEFRRRGGVPLVLNTSFNIKGQPIVENPNQAISTYYGSGLDALFMGPYLLAKQQSV